MRRSLPYLAIIFVLAGLAYGGYRLTASSHSTGRIGPSQSARTYPPVSCHYGQSVSNQPLPDMTCTPGVADPNVTQANIQSTICRSGYTRTVRPPVSFTDQLKRNQMVAYGDTGQPSAYEEDHLIALEIGGKGSDPKNLWPEPILSAHEKDLVENAAHTAVCHNHLQLKVAQQMMAQDWVSLGKLLQVM